MNRKLVLVLCVALVALVGGCSGYAERYEERTRQLADAIKRAETAEQTIKNLETTIEGYEKNWVVRANACESRELAAKQEKEAAKVAEKKRLSDESLKKCFDVVEQVGKADSVDKFGTEDPLKQMYNEYADADAGSGEFMECFKTLRELQKNMRDTVGSADTITNSAVDWYFKEYHRRRQAPIFTKLHIPIAWGCWGECSELPRPELVARYVEDLQKSGITDFGTVGTTKEALEKAYKVGMREVYNDYLSTKDTYEIGRHQGWLCDAIERGPLGEDVKVPNHGLSAKEVSALKCADQGE